MSSEPKNNEEVNERDPDASEAMETLEINEGTDEAELKPEAEPEKAGKVDGEDESEGKSYESEA